MKQVVQNYKTGKLCLADVPPPLAKANGLLVNTIASAVSAGTERSKIELARKSLVGKALARPDQVRKVIATIKSEGFGNAFEKIRNKLDSLSPLGYSTAGIVAGVGSGCEGFRVGDRVACAGAGFANHAEVTWIPKNLCVRIPEAVSFEDASFATIGAIALQGVRQADVRLGDTVTVIGLGLLGQLTVQLLKSSGCRVVGIDVDAWKVELATASGADVALMLDERVRDRVAHFTGGRGTDSVIITAASSDNQPFILAGEIARDRAIVVLVGAVPIEIPRSPYYEKELDVRLSRSYGPGRYDEQYEEHGRDYPIGYVRWTENRNVEAVLNAIASHQVRLGHLVTHRFSFSDAERAYRIISGEEKERFLGVVLSYADGAAAPTEARKTILPRTPRNPARVGVGFIGAGSFAGGTLVPILKRIPSVELRAVTSASGLTARDFATKHSFQIAVDDPEAILADDAIDLVFIATRHATHADLVVRALDRGKSVFVEKPLALTRADLERVAESAQRNPRLIVGFNRRYSLHTLFTREVFKNRIGPLMLSVRVNAGSIPSTSWVHDPLVGGGRLIGEGCHFVDLVRAIVGSRMRQVFAQATGSSDATAVLRDNFSIVLSFEDGSLATISYTSKGSSHLPKERIEVFGEGRVVVTDDYKKSSVYGSKNARDLTTSQDKGHRDQLRLLIDAVAKGTDMPATVDEQLESSFAILAASESLQSGLPVWLGW